MIASTNQGEVTLVVESEMLVNSSDYVIDAPCKVEVSQLTGCYSCTQGSEITASCFSEQPQTVTINCGSQAFAITCDSQNSTSVQRLEFESALIDISCYTKCGGRTLHLPISGTLVYHTSLPVSVFEYNAARGMNISTLNFTDMKLPDLNPLMKTIRHHWKAALTMIGVTATMIGLTYLFGPAILIAVFKIAFSLIKTMAMAVTTLLRFSSNLIFDRKM